MRRSVVVSFLAGFAVVGLIAGGVTFVRSVTANAGGIDPATSSAIDAGSTPNIQPTATSAVPKA